VEELVAAEDVLLFVNAALIIRNLLLTSAEVGPEERRREGRLIARRPETLPPQRVYRLFRELRRAKANNRRIRAIMRDWLAGRRPGLRRRQVPQRRQGRRPARPSAPG